MDLNGLKVTIFVEEGLAVYVVSRDMVLRAVLSPICPIRCPQGIHIWHVYV